IVEALRKDGLRISDLDGRDRRIGPETLAVSDDPALALRNADIVLVTVKSGATEEMAALVAAHARPDA
ncbi:MAG: 2-dehydropantoate 2-reductase, partial [Mesorhizobium sp.]